MLMQAPVPTGSTDSCCCCAESKTDTTCMSFSRYFSCLNGVHYNISCSVVIIVMMEYCVRVAVTPASNLEGPSFKSQLEDFFLNS